MSRDTYTDESGVKYWNHTYDKCDLCDKKWKTMKCKWSWPHKQNVLAWVVSVYGESYILCRRCYKQEQNQLEEPRFYIKERM